MCSYLSELIADPQTWKERELINRRVCYTVHIEDIVAIIHVRNCGDDFHFGRILELDLFLHGDIQAVVVWQTLAVVIAEENTYL